ncbi:MAG: isoleucine--tRNA ligase [Acidobacteria bacterium]|nr:isoleucine--tRNA ligase [Acidobacteriota bacterium]
MPEWKDTCNLPRTAFSMKANLQTTEPEAIARWDAMDLYGRIRAARQGAPLFLLHDGPPYANGEIHIGTALNKILKDLVVKSHNMAGYDAPYLPGWDCHGLPIELKVDRELGPKKKQMSTADFRRACRAYAEKYVDIQRRDFKRLGILGLWDDPYKTMAFRYQASIVRALGRFVEQGMVYKGKKPVHWCTHCRTALAEAEVEYEPHTSPSIYVEFPLAESSLPELARRVPALAPRLTAPSAPSASSAAPASASSVSVLIWTTTPWTIPSNLAIAFHPEFRYAAYDVDGTAVVVAKDLAASVAQKTGRAFGEPLAEFDGTAMERLSFRHPLYARDALGVLADYVTLEAGTGAVHTAPGHGADDYRTGVKYGLDIYAPLDAGGHFVESVALFGGLQVFDANPRVEAALAERGRLWHREDYDHSYPHCWRCHNPVIFLATAQWFIAMEAHDLRARALSEIRDRVRWIPAWGQARIEGMIANRPDWCISRQRAWGVPIPAMDCTTCGQAVLTGALVERAAAVFDEFGADAWYERPVEEFIPGGLACPACGGTSFERESNILDVWFDSGSSHEAVLPFREHHRWPADLYLEGSDQHRGWFHSSLLVGIGTRGRAPFDQVLTHGFVVDEQGRKMSKSLGNSVAPQDVIKQSGAEILRLWVSMVDYREDIRLGKEILARTVEAYRKIRNVIRVLVANLYDFDPVAGAVPHERMLEIDRWALAKYAECADRIVRAYDDYDYPAIFQAASTFITVDMSAFYVDVTKDRMYTFGANSEARRSGQTAMFTIVDGLARLLAPILSVTMDELWRALPGGRAPSVHMALFPMGDETARLRSPALLDRFATLGAVRDEVNLALEQKRQEQVIKANLSAQVRLETGGEEARLLADCRDFLPTLFGVSHVELVTRSGSGPDGGQPRRITVTRADGVRCERCWRFVPAVSDEPATRGLCARCVEALALVAGH